MDDDDDVPQSTMEEAESMNSQVESNHNRFGADATASNTFHSRQETVNTAPNTSEAPQSPSPASEQFPDNLANRPQTIELIKKYDDDMEKYHAECAKHASRLYRVRVLVAFCGLGIVVSAVLFTVMGMDALTQSIDSTKDGLGQITTISQETISLLNLFQERQTTAQESTEKFILDMNGA